MAIQSLNHVNLRTNRLDDMITWYVEVLGLENGKRPNFPFKGAWLYAGDTAFVHLIEVDGDAGAGSDRDLKLEHFAFAATDLEGFTGRLEAKGVKYSRAELAEIGLVQINVWDPDGNHIHVDFT